MMHPFFFIFFLVIGLNIRSKRIVPIHRKTLLIFLIGNFFICSGTSDQINKNNKELLTYLPTNEFIEIS